MQMSKDGTDRGTEVAYGECANELIIEGAGEVTEEQEDGIYVKQIQ